jgi:hypothetical protein
MAKAFLAEKVEHGLRRRQQFLVEASHRIPLPHHRKPRDVKHDVAELARLAVKAKSETARIAAIRELLDRGYGRPRQAVEVSAPAGDPLQELFEEIDALNRKRT